MYQLISDMTPETKRIRTILADHGVLYELQDNEVFALAEFLDDNMGEWIRISTVEECYRELGY